MFYGRQRRFMLVAIILFAVLAAGGCATGMKTRNASSIVDFLYPNTKDPVVAPGIPVLPLPIRMGIGFVPGGSGYKDYSSSALTENRKMELLQQVADQFKRYPFVKEIEIIPSAYLKPRGGFSNLKQIRTMYATDVIALVSYDQVQFTNPDALSLPYWSIAGADVISGEENDTHTMLDTVFINIQNKSLLFRAAGSHHVKATETPENLSEQLRLDSDTGFFEAAKAMLENLEQQLTLFKDRVKEPPEEHKPIRASAYQRSQDLSYCDALLIAAAAASRFPSKDRTG